MEWIEDYAASCRCFFSKEKTRFLTAGIAVLVCGLIAHAYGFLNLSVLHDSLYEFSLSKEIIAHKTALGRFMVPVYLYVFHGEVSSLPWLSGLLALGWLSISVWLTAYLFSITDKLRIFLIAGIFSLNITVTALTATYMHDLDAGMFAVMLAVGMVFLWHRGGKSAWLGVPLLVAVLGIYQSIISVAISLVMFLSILALLRGDKAGAVVRKGLQAILIIIAAGIVYSLAVKLSLGIAGIALSSEASDGLTNLWERRGGLGHHAMVLWKTYCHWFAAFTHSARSLGEMTALHAMLAVPALVALAFALAKKSLPNWNKILVLGLGALLPLGMNIAQFASDGMASHDLMFFAVWLIYLLAILITDHFATSGETPGKLSKICRKMAVFALVLIFATNIQTANTAYVKRDLDRQATLAIMALVNAEMNRTDGYVAGKTKVAFVGCPAIDIKGTFTNLPHIAGFAFNPISFPYIYRSYFRYVLRSPIVHPSEFLGLNSIPKEFSDTMKSFPEKGYIKWYGDVLVVKLSEEINWAEVLGL